MKKKILAIIGASSLIVAITISLVLAVSPVLAAGYTAVFTINNTSGTTYTNVPFFVQKNNAYLAANSYESTSGLDVKLQNSTQAIPLMPTTYQAWFVNPTILGGSSYNLQWSSANVSTLTNGQGVGGGVATVGGSSAAAGVNLPYSPAQTTVVVSSVGTFTIYLGSQNGYVTSGTTTVTGSPVTLSAGTNTITTTGSGGTFFITLSMPFIVGYNGYATVPETAALEPGSSFSISANGDLNTTAPNTGNTLTNGSGTATGSPISLAMSQTTTVACTGLGNFTLTVNSGAQDVITSGTTTIAYGSVASPITLQGGTYTLTASGSTGNFTIAVSDNMYIVSKASALSVYVDPTTSGTIDAQMGGGGTISQTTTNADVGLYNGGTTRAGERFTALSVGITITSIQFNLDAYGSPTGTITCNVRNSSGDSIIGTLGTMSAASLTGSYAYYTFNTTPVNLGSVTDFRIDIEYSGGNVSNGVSVGYYSTSSVYSGGVYSTYNGSWTDQAAQDLTWQNMIVTTPLLSVAGIPSGVHTVTCSFLSGTFTLTIDSTSSTASFIGSVPSNSNIWYIDEGNVMPWVNYYTETVSSVEKLRFQPETILTNGTSSYTSGTATFTTSSATVTGAATTWTQSMVGGTIKDNTDNVVYTIHSVESATSLTLSSAYVQTGQTGGSGAAYTLTYYPTATLIDLDNGYNGTIYFGFNPSLGTTGGVNNEPSISDFTPVNVVSYYVPPTTVVPDLAQIPSNEGGAITNYTAGTALFTQGSPQVTGFGTSWTSTMIGGFIMLNSDGNNYTISNVSSGTTLSLSKNYTGNSGTGSGGAYTLQYLSGGINAEDTLQTNNIIAPWFAPFAVITNIPLLIFFVVLGSVVLFGVLVWVMQQTQNQFMGAIVLIIGESFLYKLGIYQFWFIVVSAFICIAIVIYERKPAM